jgi:hypothetical protein
MHVVKVAGRPQHPRMHYRAFMTQEGISMGSAGDTVEANKKIMVRFVDCEWCALLACALHV